MDGVITLRNGDCEAEVSPAGGAVLQARLAGMPLFSPSRSPGLATLRHGQEACFPLVPFGGRIEHNGFSFEGREHRMAPNTADPLVLHGDGWLRAWSLSRMSASRADLVLQVRASGASPYAYRAEQAITLLPRGLRLTLSVENRGPDRLPFGLGFHPFLRVTAGAHVAFDAGGCWSEREMHLPGTWQALSGDLDFSVPRAVPDRWINNCYEDWEGSAMIRHPDGRALVLTADPMFRWLMVYKPEGQPGFLCLEPMSHRPNAHTDPLSGGLVLLEPGQALAGSMTITVLD